MKYAHSRFQMLHAATTMVRKHGYSALLHLPACRVWHVHDNEYTPWEPCLAILSFANFDLLQRSFTWGKPREKKHMEMPRCVILKVDPWASTVLDLYIYVQFLFLLIVLYVPCCCGPTAAIFLMTSLQRWIPVAWLTTVERQLFHFPASHARAFTWAARSPGRGQHEKPWR